MNVGLQMAAPADDTTHRIVYGMTVCRVERTYRCSVCAFANGGSWPFTASCNRHGRPESPSVTIDSTRPEGGIRRVRRRSLQWGN